MAKKIALIQGGMGSEREVSLNTGASFAKALDELLLDYVVIDADATLPQKLMAVKPDVALLALHGKYGEDGTVQGICEYLKIPYTGTGVLGSALCMDKILSKQIMQNQNIPTPAYEILDTNKVPAAQIKWTMKAPLVVKPARDGSSVAVAMIHDDSKVRAAIEAASKLDHMILIEEMIIGTEITVPILNDETLTPIEIAPKTAFYNYENKYTAGATDYYLPARIDAKIVQKCEEYALKASRVLRTRSYCRVDVMVSKDGKPYVLEVNTLPGATQTSLLPKAAKHKGIAFSKVIQTLIEHATTDYAGLR